MDKKIIASFVILTVIVVEFSIYLCTERQTSKPSEQPLEDTVKGYLTTYNAEDFTTCLTYFTDYGDEEEALAFLSYMRNLSGPLELREIIAQAPVAIQMGSRTVTVMVVFTIWGEEGSEHLHLKEVEGQWKIVWKKLDLRCEVVGSGKHYAMRIGWEVPGPIDVVVKLEWQNGSDRVSSFPIKTEGQERGYVEIQLEEDLYQRVWYEEYLLNQRFENGELSLQDFYHANWDLLGRLQSEHNYSYGKYTVVVEESSGKLVQTSEVEYSWNGREFVKLVSASQSLNPQQLGFYMYDEDRADIQVMAFHGSCAWRIVDDLGQLYCGGGVDSTSSNYERLGHHCVAYDDNIGKHFWLEVDAAAPDDDWLIEIWGWQ